MISLELIAAIVVYVAFAAEFIVRYALRRPVRHMKLKSSKIPERQARELDTKVKLMLFGLSFSTLCIFIRYVLAALKLVYCSLNF